MRREAGYPPRFRNSRLAGTLWRRYNRSVTENKSNPTRPDIVVKLATLVLYAIAIAYPFYEFRVEGTPLVSYEGVGSVVFPLAVLAFQMPWAAKSDLKPSLRCVFSQLLGAAVLATLAQFIYLGVQGYLHQPEEMQQMIRFDWIALPVVLLILWLINRKRSHAVG